MSADRSPLFEKSDIPVRKMPDDYISFSAKTCLELLHDNKLSDDQLDYEFDFCKNVLGLDFSFQKATSKLARSTKSSCLNNSLVDQVKIDMNQLVTDNTKQTNLLNSISSLIERAERLETELHKVTTTHISQSDTQDITHSEKVCGAQTDIGESACNVHSDVHVLPDYVTIVENVESLQKINITELCSNLQFKRIANRQVAYFGCLDYTYSNVIHRSCEYPENPYLDIIFVSISQCLNLPDFNKENYTCLFTLYENGGGIYTGS